MTPWRTAVLSLSAVLSCLLATPAEAGWQGTFQATCFRKWCRGCDSTPVVANFAPSACCPQPTTSCCAPACPPVQCCETRYVQRSFYQPVTTMQCRTVTEPVTTMRTSYFWEPQTTCRQSCYWDPCTCSFRMVSTPVTTYALRAQSCPVTSFVQRTMMVPVTSYRIATYFEPQTVCSTPTAAAPVVASASPSCCGSAPSVAAPAVTGPAVTENPGQAGVQESRQPAAPPTNGTSPLYDQKNSSPLPQAGTNGNQTGFRPIVPRLQAPPAAPARQPVTAPRLDKIAQADDAPKARLARRVRVVED